MTTAHRRSFLRIPGASERSGRRSATRPRPLPPNVRSAVSRPLIRFVKTQLSSNAASPYPTIPLRRRSLVARPDRKFYQRPCRTRNSACSEPPTYRPFSRLVHRAQADFESLDRGSGAKFVDPLAAFAYQMEGADSRIAYGTPASFFRQPRCRWGNGGTTCTGRLVRDVPFTAYATSPIAQAADRHQAIDFRHFMARRRGGKVIPANLFRSNLTGSLVSAGISPAFSGSRCP